MKSAAYLAKNLALYLLTHFPASGSLSRSTSPRGSIKVDAARHVVARAPQRRRCPASRDDRVHGGEMGKGEATRDSVPPRVIKRYSNRKLYDTKASEYVTLLTLADMVRSGEPIRVIDNATKEDKTDVTLALIISEELKANPREIPVAALRALLRSRGERLVSQLRDGPIGWLFRGEENGGGESPQIGGAEEPRAPGSEAGMGDEEESGAARRFRATLEQYQQVLDERIRVVLPRWAGYREHERRLEDLTRRVEDLERRLGPSPAGKSSPRSTHSRE